MAKQFGLILVRAGATLLEHFCSRTFPRLGERLARQLGWQLGDVPAMRRASSIVSALAYVADRARVFITSSWSLSSSRTKPRPPQVGHWRSSSVSSSTTPSPLQSGQVFTPLPSEEVFMCVCVPDTLMAQGPDLTPITL